MKYKKKIMRSLEYWFLVCIKYDMFLIQIASSGIHMVENKTHIEYENKINKYIEKYFSFYTERNDCDRRDCLKTRRVTTD